MAKSFESTSPGREQIALGRRQFLILGSAAVAGVAATSVSAGTITAIAAPSAGSVLSVGYMEGMLAEGPLADAGRFRSGDARFRDTSVRLTVQGAWRPESRRDERISIHLSTFFPHMTADGRLPLLAWTSSNDLCGSNVSGRVSFVVPVDENGTLPIAVERIERSAFSRFFGRKNAAPQALPNLVSLEQSGSVCRLASGSSGDLHLRRGTYFIALRASNRDRTPNWSSIAIENAGSAAQGLLTRNGRAVDFEYVALTVDYAA